MDTILEGRRTVTPAIEIEAGASSARLNEELPFLDAPTVQPPDLTANRLLQDHETRVINHTIQIIRAALPPWGLAVGGTTGPAAPPDCSILRKVIVAGALALEWRAIRLAGAVNSLAVTFGQYSRGIKISLIAAAVVVLSVLMTLSLIPSRIMPTFGATAGSSSNPKEPSLVDAGGTTPATASQTPPGETIPAAPAPSHPSAVDRAQTSPVDVAAGAPAETMDPIATTVLRSKPVQVEHIFQPAAVGATNVLEAETPVTPSAKSTAQKGRGKKTDAADATAKKARTNKPAVKKATAKKTASKPAASTNGQVFSTSPPPP